jgi:endonuclease III
MQLAFNLGEGSILPEIRSRLISMFGAQGDALRLDPLSQLVNAMISSRTSDAISLPAFERLARRYASWELLMRAAPEEIEAIIRPVRFADRKAVQLRLALRMIAARNGALDLWFLADWDDEAALQWLDGLPGVGAKIAATVLNFSLLRKRTLAVDTHLLRVGMRLGLLPQGADYATGYETFMRLVPDDWDADTLYEFHWLMKYHGRKTCTHAMPACAHCPLHEICPSQALAIPSVPSRSDD